MIRFLIILALTSGGALATSFKPQPIEQQIKESDGLFQGNYLKSKSVILEDGSVATQMVFKISKEVGLDSENFGLDEVIVHYPGGQTTEGEVRVEGVPQFVTGEKVVLFIRSVDNRYWGMNLAFGSFKVINYGQDMMLVNVQFPDHPQVGQVNFEHFEKRVREIKGKSLKIVESEAYIPSIKSPSSDRAPASVSERQNRAIASVSDQSDNEEDRPGMSIFWLVIALGFTGGLFRMTRQRHTHK